MPAHTTEAREGAGEVAVMTISGDIRRRDGQLRCARCGYYFAKPATVRQVVTPGHDVRHCTGCWDAFSAEAEVLGTTRRRLLRERYPAPPAKKR